MEIQIENLKFEGCTRYDIETDHSFTCLGLISISLGFTWESLEQLKTKKPRLYPTAAKDSRPVGLPPSHLGHGLEIPLFGGVRGYRFTCFALTWEILGLTHAWICLTVLSLGPKAPTWINIEIN